MKLSIKKDKTPTKIPFIIPMKVCFPITSKTLASETSFPVSYTHLTLPTR